MFLQAAICGGDLYVAPLGTPLDLGYAAAATHPGVTLTATDPAWKDLGPVPLTLGYLHDVAVVAAYMDEHREDP